MRYAGKFLGRVEEITDPKKMRRIKAEVPEIAPGLILDWALPCDAHLTDWLPEVGDYVWMEFRGGDIDHPIWAGLAVAKDRVDADFIASYGSAYRKDRDANGNEIEWTPDQSSLGAAAILVNGTKRLANEDLVAWIKTNVLDWIQTNVTGAGGWLATHLTQDVTPPATIPVAAPSLVTLAVLDVAWTAVIADYEAKRAAGGANLTDKVKAG